PLSLHDALPILYRHGLLFPAAAFSFYILARRPSELSQRQRVTVWIGEPRDTCAAWGRPDPEIVLRHPLVPLEDDATLHQVAHGLRDVRHDPAEDCVTRWLERLHNGDAEHRATGVERQCEAILPSQAKSPRFGIEGFPAFRIGCRNERNDRS